MFSCYHGVWIFNWASQLGVFFWSQFKCLDGGVTINTSPECEAKSLKDRIDIVLPSGTCPTKLTNISLMSKIPGTAAERDKKAKIAVYGV